MMFGANKNTRGRDQELCGLFVGQGTNDMVVCLCRDEGVDRQRSNAYTCCAINAMSTFKDLHWAASLSPAIDLVHYHLRVGGRKGVAEWTSFA